MNHSPDTPFSAIALSQLLVTKLCHDVANPIGAINNGMELLEEDDSMREAAMELIGSSAQQAGARIQFYRYIFGMLKGEGIVDMRDKKALIEGFYKGSKVEVVWTACPDTMTQPECQILCNLLCIAGASLVRGGVVTIETRLRESGAVASFSLSAAGTHLKLDDDMKEALLQHGKHTPSAKSVQAYYTALLVDEQGGKVSLNMQENTYLFQYQPPSQ